MTTNFEEWGKYRGLPVCSYVQKVRDRQKRDLWRAKHDLDFPYYFDEEAADHAVWFFKQLRHFDGEWAGQPFELADWQEWDIIRPLFGWKQKPDPDQKDKKTNRRFRYAYIEIPRRNGKSGLAAGLNNYLYIGDGEYGAQVYTAATKEEQARIVWDASRKMIELSPMLRDEIKVTKKIIECPELGSFCKPLGRDSKTQDGFSVHGAVIDEYHAHPTSDLRNVLMSGRGSRRQPLVVIITTAGFGVASPCKKESDIAKRILDQELENDAYFTFIACADDPRNWEDPQEWIKANPNWGISVYQEQFQDDYEQAKIDPEYRDEFLTKRLNIWLKQSSPYIQLNRWKECGGTINWDRFKGKPCWGGLDLGVTEDISALLLAFPDPDTYDESGNGLVFLKGFYWVPDEGLRERYKKDGVNYPQWRDQGLLYTSEGSTTRTSDIRLEIARLRTIFDIREIAVDQAHASELIQHLSDDGLNIFKHSQSMMSMNFGCRALKELTMSHRLQHGGDPILEWSIGNVYLVKDGNENMKADKSKSKDRIDPVVAAHMAIGRLLITPYEEIFNRNDDLLVVL